MDFPVSRAGEGQGGERESVGGRESVAWEESLPWGQRPAPSSLSPEEPKRYFMGQKWLSAPWYVDSWGLGGGEASPS